MKIVIGAATLAEIKPLLDHLQVGPDDEVTVSGHQVHFLITGIGSTITAISWLTNTQASLADFWLMTGIAGTYHEDWIIGNVLEVVREQWGDLGAEHANGAFEDVFSLGLMERGVSPYQNGCLHNPETYTKLRQVKGLTVHTTSGSPKTIRERITLCRPDIETMEGAGFFHAALVEGKKFCQIRALSNHVEPRDRSKWDISLALTNLTTSTLDLIASFPRS